MPKTAELRAVCEPILRQAADIVAEREDKSLSDWLRSLVEEKVIAAGVYRPAIILQEERQVQPLEA